MNLGCNKPKKKTEKFIFLSEHFFLIFTSVFKSVFRSPSPFSGPFSDPKKRESEGTYLCTYF